MTIINRKKKSLLTSYIPGLLVALFFTSCVDRFDKIEKYQRPDRLEGKIYTLISNQDNMSIFSQLMVDVGYDKIVNKTGTYAAFVPSDSVMELFLKEKYGSTDLSAISAEDKGDIVKFHILQMPWSKDQLQKLNSRGWINLTDVSNNKPTAFKRKTLLREPNKTYKIKRFLTGDDPYDIIVPNSSSSTTTRTVYTNSPKYAPLFFDGFMEAKGLTSSDYSYYFDRSYESGEVFFANAKVVGSEIFAENGFVYTLDKVVEPLQNAEQILEAGPYSEFLQLVHNNSVFQENQSATLAQEGAQEGAQVETLYNLSYTSNLAMNIHSELVGTSATSVERHNGLLAPTNDAMEQFFQKYLTSWGSSWSAVPNVIQLLFVNAHMTGDAIYQKDISEGFYNGVGDIVSDKDFKVSDVHYGSNSTVLSLSEAITPKFISSVSAPLFLAPEFNTFFYSYDATDLLYSMKDPSTEFSLFLVNNRALALDSTIMSAREVSSRKYEIKGYDHGQEKIVNLLNSEYKNIFKRRLYGHIGVQPILGVAKREFVETIDGRHMVVQNDTITGGATSEFGFNSGRDTTVVFSEITDFPITNGKAYSCDGWLNFSTQNAYNHLLVRENGIQEPSKFLRLLNTVGYANIGNNRLTFTDPTERYTIFVPSNAALEAIEVDTFTVDELKELVSFHIVKGDLIFTDGRLPQKAYRTFNNRFINLNPQPDNLVILDENNDVYYDQLTQSSKTNLFGMYQQNIAENYYITNAVLHKIDTVIMPY